MCLAEGGGGDGGSGGGGMDAGNAAAIRAARRKQGLLERYEVGGEAYLGDIESAEAEYDDPEEM